MEFLDKKATLFSTISVINTIALNFKDGKIAPDLYNKQLQGLVRDYYYSINFLKNRGLNIQDFFYKENIYRKFPAAMERIRNQNNRQTQHQSQQKVHQIKHDHNQIITNKKKFVVFKFTNFINFTVFFKIFFLF